MTYDYDAAAGQSGVTSTAGNTHQLISISGTINGTTESASYTYDLQKRLVTSNQTGNGSSAQRRFAFDRWGNRTNVWDAITGGNQIQAVTLQQSGGAPTNRITSVTNNGTPSNYVYDAAVNVTDDGVHTYTFDAANRLVSVDGGATAQYRYDHQNQRVTKIVGSSWRHYIWEGGRVIGEHDGTTAYTTSPPYQQKSARLDYIYARGRMIHTRERASSTAPWTTRYYVSDVWSTRLVLDASGNVLGRQGHLAFGEEFAESGTQEKHHFTSYEAESETATYYAVNRQYSQSLGRFGSADPYQASSFLVNPQSWNRYSYVENDPIHNVDPLGLLAEFPGPGADPCCVSCTGGDEPQQPAKIPCRDQDFSFGASAGRYTAVELEALAQMAVGEAGGFFDRREIEAVISTAVNRQNYNIAYVNSGANRGPFNGGTDIIGILKAGYDATKRRQGYRKLDQANGQQNVLYEGDYVCDQLKAAKDYARLVATLTPEQILAMYPLTYNHARQRAVPRDAFNVVHYGQSWFWMSPLPRP